MGVYCSLLLGKWLYDINAQPKLFSKSFYKKYLSLAFVDFSLDLFLLYQAQKNDYSIECFPVQFKPRQSGEAKGGGGSLTNRIKLVLRTYKYINKLKNRFIP